MPNADEILTQLTSAANGAKAVAVGWHVAFGVALFWLLLGWRPSQRMAGQLLSAPLASVSITAFVYRSPFNGIVFALIAIVLFFLGRRSSTRAVRRGSPPLVALGVVMTALGWFYPHFLDGEPAVTYAYAAPLGVVPCATLYAVTGLALMGGRVASRSWIALLAGTGVFYGVFGYGRLGVRADVGLVVGAGMLGLLAVMPRPPKPAMTRAP